MARASTADTIAGRIERIRREAGLSQQVFARALEIDEKSCRRYLAGEVIPKAPTLLVIARRFGVSIDWIVRGDPKGLAEWLASPLGVDASPQVRRFMRSLPHDGWEPTRDTYDAICVAVRAVIPATQDGAEREEATRSTVRPKAS